MSGRLPARAIILLVTLAGLATTVALLVHVGLGDVLGVVQRIGFAGFLGYVSITGGLLIVLGFAWLCVAPGTPARWFPAFFWGRTTREAATDVLPFSQIGGIVVGARSLIAAGVPPTQVYASLVADQTTELAAQLVYTLYGVAALALLLSAGRGGDDLLVLSGVGAVASIAIMLAFTFLQRPLLQFAGRIGGAILPGSAAALAGIGETLDVIYRQHGRVIASFLLHLVAWVGSGAGAWVALALVGADIGIGKVIVIESLIFTLRTAAFVVPGGIGLQEGAYLLLAPLFGLPAEAALALSLLKRARDLAIGIPVMIAWSWGEGRSIAGNTG
jgi:putative membrane protein